jgi:hypothetical protein
MIEANSWSFACKLIQFLIIAAVFDPCLHHPTSSSAFSDPLSSRNRSSVTAQLSDRIMSNVNSQPIPTLYVNNIESKVKKDGE